MQSAQSRMLLVMAAILIVAVTVLVVQGPDDAQLDPDATEVVWSPVGADDIVGIRVTHPADTLVLERTETGWDVVEPVRDVADADSVRELLDDLREIHRGIPVDAPPARAGDFGLGDPPDARVEITLTDGGTQSVDVGIPVPVGYRTYMRAASGVVVAANGNAGETLQKRAQGYRDHRIFRFDPGAVRRVLIEGPEGTLAVHGEGTQWWVEGYARAEPDRVDDLVLGLLDLRFDVVLGLEEAVAEPVFRIEVTEEGGQTHTARVGRETPMGVLTATSDGRVGAVFPQSLALIGQGPRHVSDPGALPLDLERDDVLTVRAAGQTWTARRNGPSWTSDGQEEGAVRGALDALVDVPILVRSDPPPESTEDYAVFEIERAASRRVVRIGQRVEGEFRTAIDEAGGQPYRVVAAAIEAAVEALPRSDQPAP